MRDDEVVHEGAVLYAIFTLSGVNADNIIIMFNCYDKATVKS